jgi:hypothetical protein
MSIINKKDEPKNRPGKQKKSTKENLIDVSVFKNGSPKTDTKLNFTWSIVKSSNSTISIKVVWANAFVLVANADETYELQFIFKGSGFTGKSGHGIPKGFTLRVPIPT